MCARISNFARASVYHERVDGIVVCEQELLSLAAGSAGCEGVAAINTIQSVMGINLKTLRPEPSVEGYSTPGGYSCKAVKPIALAKACLCLRFRCRSTCFRHHRTPG